MIYSTVLGRNGTLAASCTAQSVQFVQSSKYPLSDCDAIITDFSSWLQDPRPCAKPPPHSAMSRPCSRHGVRAFASAPRARGFMSCDC